LLTVEWRQGLFFNVNFPNCPPDEVAGVQVTRQGLRPVSPFRPVGRIDERHVPYWWIKINFPEGGEAKDNDLGAVVARQISVTPLQIDMTAYDMLPELRQNFSSLQTPAPARHERALPAAAGGSGASR
jgi:5'-nucleotidase